MPHACVFVPEQELEERSHAPVDPFLLGIRSHKTPHRRAGYGEATK